MAEAKVNTLLETNAAGKVQPTKFDSAKVDVGLYPVRALIETCKVFHYGSIVYSVGNWKEGDGFAYRRLANSAQRHIEDFKLGIDYDFESSLHVLGHAQCCIAMLLETVLTGGGKDDRKFAQITDKGEDLSQLMIMPEGVIERAIAKRTAVEAMRATVAAKK